MKYSVCVLLCSIVLAVMSIIGCSDEPNAVGIKILPPQDSLQVISYDASVTSVLSFLTRVRGTSSTFLVGKSSGIEARTMLQFSGISAIPTTSTIDSAVLTLHINYRFKDSSGTMGFEVRKLLAAFTGAQFTWDSTNASGAYSDTVSGTFLKNITPQDSILTLRLDTTLIQQWRSIDGGSVILLPSANVVVGMSNVSSPDQRPLLTISYHDSTDTTKTLSPRSSGGLFVADKYIIVPSLTSFNIEAGVAYRGIVRFDSLTIPSKVSITQAVLELPLDTTSSLLNSYSTDNLVVYLLRKNVSPYDSLALGTSCTPAYVNGQKIYRADIKAIVQQWFIREPNYGLLLRAGGELVTLDQFALYNTSASAALRPKIKITYTVLP